VLEFGTKPAGEAIEEKRCSASAPALSPPGYSSKILREIACRKRSAAMPYEMEISKEERMARVRGHGALRLELCLETIRGIAQHPDFEPDYRVIVDLRESEYVPAADEVREITEEFRRFASSYQNKVALVASESLNFGVARMISSFVEAGGVRISAFKDMHSAQEWLEER
jgi:hypothetical protein